MPKDWLLFSTNLRDLLNDLSVNLKKLLISKDRNSLLICRKFKIYLIEVQCTPYKDFQDKFVL